MSELAVVQISDWEIDCCVGPFVLGASVAWPVRVVNGVAWANVHITPEDDLPTQSGVIESIEVGSVLYERQGRTYTPVSEHPIEFRPIESDHRWVTPRAVPESPSPAADGTFAWFQAMRVPDEDLPKSKVEDTVARVTLRQA